MSHIVTITTEIRDPIALQASCRRLRLDEPVFKTVKLFSDEATGHCVQLPRWRYPVVCDTESGTVQFDNFNGRWGEPCELERLMQAYACEKVKLEARRQGHSVTERTLNDGAIRLTIQVGEAT
ncbi:MAG: DUF1257 domain-containing protein [Planctomycetaceae bacterium]|nr:DUF1257 domain-containing protein [Planctomycetales bacterium]MCA9144139.1 DUF1257 domain-containing protein [Planctomycetales bacterium]MCB9941311.1 DUF1257 domain-containing protein [Planctomycetaceae bacterium]